MKSAQLMDFGFAVFKLKPAADPKEVHPLAFEFPRRNDLLYFPTLHIHDGEIHPNAQFDHMLYCQPNHGMEECLSNWHRSSLVADQFMDGSIRYSGAMKRFVSALIQTAERDGDAAAVEQLRRFDSVSVETYEGGALLEWLAEPLKTNQNAPQS
jgi:hypothetical protein